MEKPKLNNFRNATCQAKGLPRRRGFTLVELIVVITILAILGTIGFLSINGYSTGARDASRVSDLVQLAKQMDSLVAQGTTLPSPDGTSIAIMSSGTVIGIQGYAGANVQRVARFSGKGKDPLEGQYYTYLVNTAGTKYQLLGLLEGSSIALSNPLVSTAYAADYGTRTPVARGGSLGVFLGAITGSTLNQPLQELASGSFTGIDLLANTNGNYKAYLETGKVFAGSGNGFFELVGRLDNSLGTYPGCDTPNIKLGNGQIWAACNVGAVAAYTNQALTIADGSPTGGPTSAQKTYIGNYFQWWRTADATTPSLITGPVATDPGSGFITVASSPNDWLLTPNPNLWWGSSTTPSAGTFAWATASDQWLMQGACATGYHVPTALEWCNALRFISPDIPSCDSTWRSESVANLFRTTLKLPVGGYRNLLAGSYGNSGSNGYYWTVSPYSGNAYSVEITPTQVRAAPANNRAHGFSIRCMKN